MPPDNPPALAPVDPPIEPPESPLEEEAEPRPPGRVDPSVDSEMASESEPVKGLAEAESSWEAVPVDRDLSEVFCGSPEEPCTVSAGDLPT